MELLHVFAASHYGECRILSLKLAHLYSSRSATTFQTRFLNTVLKRVTLLLGFYIVIEPFITGLYLTVRATKSKTGNRNWGSQSPTCVRTCPYIL